MSVRSFDTQQGKRFAHVFRQPAPDSYSHPGTVEISATRRLADVEQDAQILCMVGGSPSSFDMKDKDTGEVRKVSGAMIRLTAVE